MSKKKVHEALNNIPSGAEAMVEVIEALIEYIEELHGKQEQLEKSVDKLLRRARPTKRK